MLLTSVAFSANRSVTRIINTEKEHPGSSLSRNQTFIKTIQSLIDLNDQIAPFIKSEEFEKIKNATATKLEIEIFLRKIGHYSPTDFLHQQEDIANNLKTLRSNYPESFKNNLLLKSEIKNAIKSGKLDLISFTKNEDCFLNFMAMLAACAGIATLGDELLGKEEDYEYSAGTLISIWALCVAAAWVYLSNCE